MGGHTHPRYDEAASRREFAEERPTLGPLPVETFRYYRYGERTVHLDGCRSRGRVLRRATGLDPPLFLERFMARRCRRTSSQDRTRRPTFWRALGETLSTGFVLK